VSARTNFLPPPPTPKPGSIPKKGLQRIALYAGRIQRAIEKNTAELKAMQAERKAAYAQARDEAIVLTQLAASKGQTIDPARDFPSPESNGGFIYAPEEIARILSRARRLEEARARFGGAGYAPQSSQSHSHGTKGAIPIVQFSAQATVPSRSSSAQRNETKRFFCLLFFLPLSHYVVFLCADLRTSAPPRRRTASNCLAPV
jgi:hypothetical protein